MLLLADYILPSIIITDEFPSIEVNKLLQQFTGYDSKWIHPRQGAILEYDGVIIIPYLCTISDNLMPDRDFYFITDIIQNKAVPKETIDIIKHVCSNNLVWGWWE